MASRSLSSCLTLLRPRGQTCTRERLGGWIAFTDFTRKAPLKSILPLYTIAHGYSVMGKSDLRTVIEIERRFPFDSETENRLREAGASAVSEKSFTDTYYDTKDFRLTGADHWLRRRDEKWELKYPSPIRLSDNAAEYVESDDEIEMDGILEKLLEVPMDHSARDTLTDPLSRWDSLIDFSTIRTTRKKFTLNGVVIDLDSADFGFAIGEMEVLVIKTGDGEVDTKNHENALKALDETALTLGIVFNSKRLHGKVTTFLRQRRRKHYDYLVERGVLIGVHDE